MNIWKKGHQSICISVMIYFWNISHFLAIGDQIAMKLQVLILVLVREVATEIYHKFDFWNVAAIRNVKKVVVKSAIYFSLKLWWKLTFY